jgi:hypothetical protein
MIFVSVDVKPTVETVIFCPLPAMEYHTPGEVIEVPQKFEPAASVVAAVVLTVAVPPHVNAVAPEQLSFATAGGAVQLVH